MTREDIVAILGEPKGTLRRQTSNALVYLDPRMTTFVSQSGLREIETKGSCKLVIDGRRPWDSPDAIHELAQVDPAAMLINTVLVLPPNMGSPQPVSTAIGPKRRRSPRSAMEHGTPCSKPATPTEDLEGQAESLTPARRATIDAGLGFPRFRVPHSS